MKKLYMILISFLVLLSGCASPNEASSNSTGSQADTTNSAEQSSDEQNGNEPAAAAANTIDSLVVDRQSLEIKNWDDPELLLKVRWSGVNFYEFVLPNGKTIVMDPYYDMEPAGGHNEYNYTPTELPAGEWVNGADYIVLTHGHFDHVGDLNSVLTSYPSAHVIAPELVMPSIMWECALNYSSHYIHMASARDILEFDGFMLETCRSNHNLSTAPSADKMSSSNSEELDFYQLYRKIYERDIMNMRITTDEGFTILIWNSEMQPDGFGFESRQWFYRDTQPDLFMYQVAGASLGYDRRNPTTTHMGEWIASVAAKAALPEHQQHFSYEELDAMAASFSEICNENNIGTAFLTPETGVWYGYAKDENGNILTYQLTDSI